MCCVHTRKYKHEGTFSMFKFQSGKQGRPKQNGAFDQLFHDTDFKTGSRSQVKEADLAPVGRGLSRMSGHRVLFKMPCAALT